MRDLSLVFAALAVAFLILPLGSIVAVNVLFDLTIPFNLKTWAAALFLVAVARFSVSVIRLR